MSRYVVQRAFQGAIGTVEAPGQVQAERLASAMYGGAPFVWLLACVDERTVNKAQAADLAADNKEWFAANGAKFFNAFDE